MSNASNLVAKELNDQYAAARRNHDMQMAEIQKSLAEKRAKLDALNEKIKQEKARHAEKIKKLRADQETEKRDRKKIHEIEIRRYFDKISKGVESYSTLEIDQKNHNNRVLEASKEEKEVQTRNSEIFEVKVAGELVRTYIEFVLEAVMDENENDISERISAAKIEIKKFNEMVSKDKKFAVLKNEFKVLETKDFDEIEKELEKFQKKISDVLKTNSSSSKSVLDVIAEKPKAAITN
ncbi:unnamed protein product [Caenorhabditis angaria]|uniref:Uncharacterized protein n=1 Tax=Caenorhabditis angaria TaxID=860376 RepID=A0A9P1IMN2_9PELO|nr:unnamed protein product [Caenorhabditis angaria]